MIPQEENILPPRRWLIVVYEADQGDGFVFSVLFFFSKHFLLYFVQEILQYFTDFTIYSYLKLNKKPKGGCMVVPIKPTFSNYSQYGIYF